MIKTLVESASANVAEWLIYAAIAVVTLIGFFKCILPVARNARGLNRATVKLENGVVSGNGPIWMDKNFLGKSLQNEWNEFLQNASQLGKRGVGCDTRDYINVESVIEKPGHAQLADLIPGLLTSLGILGTFVGLILGLSGVDFSTTTGTMDSIKVLLSGMRTAFATSVAGISCSLVFNMVNRIVIGKSRGALDNFDDSFSEIVMPRPLQADVAMLCEKKDEDARFARLFSAMGNQTATAIENAVGRAMVPLTQSMNEFIQGATREQTDGINRICNQFVFLMNKSCADQFRALKNTIGEVNEAQKHLQSSVEASILTAQAINDQSSRIVRGCTVTANAMDSIGNQLNKQQGEQLHRLENVQQAMDQLTEGLNRLSESLTKLQQEADSLAADTEGGSNA